MYINKLSFQSIIICIIFNVVWRNHFWYNISLISFSFARSLFLCLKRTSHFVVLHQLILCICMCLCFFSFIFYFWRHVHKISSSFSRLYPLNAYRSFSVWLCFLFFHLIQIIYFRLPNIFHGNFSILIARWFFFFLFHLHVLKFMFIFFLFFFKLHAYLLICYGFCYSIFAKSGLVLLF